MNYLARLQALIAEERPPEELTKLTEGAFVGSVSDEGGRFLPVEPDTAAIEERAGLAADRVPAVYLDAWSRLNYRKPFDASEADWRSALDDGGRFLDSWGDAAVALGWTVGDVFGVNEGIVWRLAGQSVEALGLTHLRLSGGKRLSRVLACSIQRNIFPEASHGAEHNLVDESSDDHERSAARININQANALQ